MKKILCIAGIVVLCASMVFAFTKNDLAGLKGTWSGSVSGMAGGQQCVATLEIANDAEPLDGKLTVANIPMQMQQDYNVPATFTGQAKGKLTSKGEIMFTGATNNFFKITSIKDKKMQGWFIINGFEGTFTGSKK